MDISIHVSYFVFNTNAMKIDYKKTQFHCSHHKNTELLQSLSIRTNFLYSEKSCSLVIYFELTTTIFYSGSRTNRMIGQISVQTTIKKTVKWEECTHCDDYFSEENDSDHRWSALEIWDLISLQHDKMLIAVKVFPQPKSIHFVGCFLNLFIDRRPIKRRYYANFFNR